MTEFNKLANEPSELTKNANRTAVSSLPFHDVADFERARRGFIATIPNGVITRPQNPSNPKTVRPAWDMQSYNFITQKQAPDSVHPSLWRLAQLNMFHGLFQVTDKVYQIRGLDISNMTIIQAENGIIIIDPLTCVETAKASLELYYTHFPRVPILAIMITHSHVDHFGGIRGVLSEEDVLSGKVPVIAPEGFLEHAVSENVFAGGAMRRRAQYMYGPFLPKGERGHVDVAIGKAISSGTQSLVQPTDFISQTGETRVIGGVQFEFQMANCTEAPCEMIIYLPQLNALCAADVMTHNMHNLYTLRGAEIRDAVQWWKTINESIELFHSRTKVIFAQHHWPIWGSEEILKFLSKQRDLYKYMHDQTVRLMNHGYTMLDIADKVELPAELGNEWFNRGTYGSVSHNVRGIYQKYLGYYSSNPAELNPLPPVAAAKKYIEFMGGFENVLKLARKSFEQGEYRWVAQVVNHVIFAEPNNVKALELQADTLEQLGYQSENATWRNNYLIGAKELRFGTVARPANMNMDMLRALTLEMCFDFLGVHLNGPNAQGKKLLMNFTFLQTDPSEPSQFVLRLENSVLTYTIGRTDQAAKVHLTLTRPVFLATFFGNIKLQELIDNKQVQISGDIGQVNTLISLFDEFSTAFPIVTPFGPHQNGTVPHL
ncbi:beta-lactamase-like protein [Umbelopsis sp. PMI_123]|nr:beta-lactamase-like protein [Umbelopsis sp. PMI_123]